MTEWVFPDEFFALAEQLPLPGHGSKDFEYHAWRRLADRVRGADR